MSDFHADQVHVDGGAYNVHLTLMRIQGFRAIDKGSLEMTPDEARLLGLKLIRAADAVDDERA